MGGVSLIRRRTGSLDWRNDEIAGKELTNLCSGTSPASECFLQGAN
jgi:hypothetical protein